MEMYSSKMHALMRLKALMDGTLIEIYAKGHLLSETFPLRMATYLVLMFVKTII